MTTGFLILHERDCRVNLRTRRKHMTEPSSYPRRAMGLSQRRGARKSLLSKEISALELTDQFIARIEALDGDLNAVPVRDFTRAREAAREADAALARRERRPILGVPVTVEES